MIIEHNEIKQIIPHRYPFLFVDRIVEMYEGERIVGIKNVSGNEEYFQGHFPGQPIMPGVLQIEAMAQVGGILILSGRDLHGKIAYFAALDNVRWKKPVVPGDELRIEMEIKKIKGPIAKMHGQAFVGGQLVCEADFTFSIGDRPTKKQIHATASIHPTAVLGKDIVVGPYAIIGENVKIGDGTIIDAHSIVEKWTEIGKNCHVYYGCVIGSTSQDMKYKGEKSFVEIGDNNELREFVTINRATEKDKVTRVGSNNLFLTNVHIGHDCQIGDEIIISNTTGISGHVIVGDKAVIGGMVGVTQFVRIGNLAMVGGYSKVNQDIPPFMLCEGNPAKVRSINMVGLGRRNILQESQSEIKKAFKLLYRSKLNLSQAIERIKEEVKLTEEVKTLLNFIEEPSAKGITLKVQEEEAAINE